MPLHNLWHNSIRKHKPSTDSHKDTQTTKVFSVSEKDVVHKNVQTGIVGNSTFINYTGNEYMQLRGSTAIMASEEAKANPLAAVIVIMSIFLFITLSVTAAVLVFCKKKNTVFTLQKCEEEDEISYEMDEINNTDIEFAEFENELEAMQQPMARKSATCPDLLDSVDRNDAPCLQRLLADTGDSETEDGKERSRAHPKLQRRSKSFTFQGSTHHGYQQMVVTAVMESSRQDKQRSKSNDGVDKSTIQGAKQKVKNVQILSSSEINLNSDRPNKSRRPKPPWKTASNLDFHSTSINDAKCSNSSTVDVSDIGFAKFDDAYTNFGDVCTYFDDATLAFLDTEGEIDIKKTSQDSQKYFVTHVPCLTDKSEMNYSSGQSKPLHSITGQSASLPQIADQSTSISHKSGQSNLNSHLSAGAISDHPEITDQSNFTLHISDQSAFSITCQSQNHSHTADQFTEQMLKQEEGLSVDQSEGLSDSIDQSKCDTWMEDEILEHVTANLHSTDDENEVLLR